MSNKKLEIRNLTKTFGSTVAVDNLSLSVNEGNIKTVLGPSGCGKTTTLRSVAGLETPDDGEIYIDGDLVFSPEENVPPEKRGIGMVFQSYAVWPHMTVEENVKYPLKAQGIGTKEERKQRTQDILEKVGLGDHGDNMGSELSGGQQQRVSVARALITEPEIILFDEPLSNLDAKLRRTMRSEIKQLCDDLSITMLYVTHSQDEAMYLSDEIAILDQGSIVEEGSPAKVYSDPENYFTMDFMGQANTLEGTVTAVSPESTTVDFGFVEQQFESFGNDVSDRDTIKLCFRPKHCEVVPSGDALPEGMVGFQGTVLSTSVTTDFVEYEIDCGGTNVLYRSSDISSQDTGLESEEVVIGVDISKMTIYDSAGKRIRLRETSTVSPL